MPLDVAPISIKITLAMAAEELLARTGMQFT
jgi:hypothetical protein